MLFKIPLAFSFIEPFKYHNPVTTLDSDTTDKFQKRFRYIIIVISDLDDTVFDDNPPSNDYGEILVMLDIKFYKFVNLKDDNIHPS